MAQLTLMDIMKMNGADKLIGLIEDTIKASPEAQMGAARTIKGTEYKTLHRTGVPQVGFRKANQGVTPVKSTWANKLVETFLLDAAAECDERVAGASEDGVAITLAKEHKGLLEGGFRSLSSQFYYGRSTTVATSTALQPLDGFPGLVDTVDSSLVYDCASAESNLRSSAWFVKWGEDAVQWVFGEDGKMDIRDPYRCRLTDANGKPYDGIRSPLSAFIGLQCVNPNAVVRVKNIGYATGGTLLTDSHLSRALELFPAGVTPDCIYMTRRSRGQLQRSRTPTNVKGDPVPLPTHYEGIPIYITDGILNTESA